MGLNISKGDMYTWVNYTWNTIKGECPHGCSYCYVKKWGKQSELHFDEKELKTDLGQGNTIFVGSSCDMFAKDIPPEWIIKTLNYCAKYDNTYLFQSKNPKGFTSLPVWELEKIVLCTTIETNRVYPDVMQNCPEPVERAMQFGKIPIEEKYVTIEPIMDFDLRSLVELISFCRPKQVNIGADSMGKKLPEPSKEKILALIDELNEFTEIDHKSNLNRLLK